MPRGRDARFTPGGTHIVFLIKPEYAAVRAGKVAKKRADDLPKDSLGILDLATGEVIRVERVKSFRVPERGGAHLAYLGERPSEEEKTGTDSTAAAPDSTAPKPKKDTEVGSPLVVRHVASGVERRYDDVTEYAFARDGGRLAAVVSSRTGETDGVLLLQLAGEPMDRRVATGRGTGKEHVEASAREATKRRAKPRFSSDSDNHCSGLRRFPHESPLAALMPPRSPRHHRSCWQRDDIPNTGSTRLFRACRGATWAP